MKKTNDAKRKRTHFEQVPLEIVRKIADGEISKTQKAGRDIVIVEPAPKKTEPYYIPTGPFGLDMMSPSGARPK